MLSDVLIVSGPVTYIGFWIIIILIILIYKPSETVTAGLITYAILPIGPIVQSGSGYIVSYFGY